jgi:hypothetical protein
MAASGVATSALANFAADADRAPGFFASARDHRLDLRRERRRRS